MSIFSKISARTMARSKTRTMVTIIGVVLSAAMITALTTFAASFRQFLIDYSISRDGNWHMMAPDLEDERAETLSGLEEVRQSARVEQLGYALFESVMEQSPQMPYLCVQALSQEAVNMLPTVLAEGRMPENAKEVLIPSWLQVNESEDQITKVGDTLTLELGERTFGGERLNESNAYMGEEETFTPGPSRSFLVVGVYDSWPNAVYGGAGYRLLAGPLEEGEGEGYCDLFLELEHPEDVYEFGSTWLKENGIVYNSSLLRWLGVVDNDSFSVVMRGLLVILTLVIMAGSISLIYNAFSISLRERSVQFGLLSSIGATRKQLRGCMRYEALFVGAVGIPIGILAGIGGIGITLKIIGSDITNFVHGTKTGIPLVVSVPSILAAALIAFLTIMISVWLPSRRIKKISPMEAIRANADIRISQKDVKTGRITGAVFGLPGMLAEKNYRRDRRKYRATVVSLTMSIVLFTTAALFQMYLMQTGAFVLDAPRWDLECHIYGDTQSGEAERMERIIRQSEGVTEVFSYRRTYLTLSVPGDWLSQSYAESWNLQPQEGQAQVPLEIVVAVYPDEQFEEYARSQNADPADYLTGEQLRLLYLNTVRIYNPETGRYEKKDILEKGQGEALPAGRMDYENDSPKFQETCQAVLFDRADQLPGELESERGQLTALIPEGMYRRFHKELRGENTAVVYSLCAENPSETYADIEKILKSSGLEENAYVENLTEQYESDRNTLAAVNVLTYGFTVLISLIAVANVFNTVSTNLMLRRKEFAMLRSMGMSPGGFRCMMYYECMIYGARAICYGALLSGAISFAIQKAVGTGADVGFLYPWGALAAAVAGVLLVVFLTMIYTMRTIKKNNIVDELKMQ